MGLLSAVLVACTTTEPKLTMEGATRHPTVAATPVDVARARQRIRTEDWAKAWYEGVSRSVREWSKKDEAWVHAVMPGEGACFAYGFTGCPICAASWGTWGGAKASFEKPGHETSANGHVLPDKDHPDPGTGYRGKDGRVHYFVGSYNAWVVETLIFKIAKPSSCLYLLERDQKAGRLAAVILDEIARIYPSCDKGSWDYPSNPPSGRLNRPWYQVARALVQFVDIYDRIFDHTALDEPSLRPGLTRRQNIEQNLLLNGAKYCYDQSVKTGGLSNGEADYLRGVLAVGVVLGIPEYIRWPVDGPYGIRTMLANNVDRDGRYFETSPSYSLHTRNLYLTFSEPLLNYRGSVFPKGLNLYDDPRFEAFNFLPQMATVVLGIDAPYGDMAPALTRRTLPYNPPTIWDCRYTEYLATRLSDPRKRTEYATLLAHLRSRDPEADKRMQDLLEWRVFHGIDGGSKAGVLTDRMKRYLDGSFFCGQQGVVVLRTGQGAEAHGAVLRFGPSLVHGHLDDLNVNYFAQGYEMTYDVGYSLGSTHTQVGWAKQTVSHNTVVVDEKSQGDGTFGGSLHHFADLAGIRIAEGSSTAYAHAGVDVYRRLIALADRYAVDVFRVNGGQKHDLPLHALSTEVTFDGLTPGQPEGGSLAGKDRNWGDLQLNDGDMKGHANKPYWNPPPGNGYGFLMQPARTVSDRDWSATWLFGDADRTQFRLTALHNPGTEIVTAVAPGLYPKFPKARHVIRRRQGAGLSSCFVSVWQGYSDRDGSPVTSVRRIGGEPSGALASVALAVDLRNGHRDLWCLSPSAESTVTGCCGEAKISVEGAIGRARLAGPDLVSAELVNGRRLNAAGWTFTMDSPSRSGVVVEHPSVGVSKILIDSAWPADGRYKADALWVENPAYSRNTAYTIDGVVGTTLVVEQADTSLGIGVVHSVPDGHTLTTKVPHEYARSVTRKGSSGFFRGKRLSTDDGRASTTIRDIRLDEAVCLRIRVDSTAGFSPGQVFRYHDVQAGDTVTVHHRLAFAVTGKGQATLQTNADVVIAPPPGIRLRYVDKTGTEAPATGGQIPRSALPPSGESSVRWEVP